MESHTIILSSPKISIPENNIIEFTKGLIVSNLLNIDYFGMGIDNQLDYIDDEMASKIESTTYITFDFDFGELYYRNFEEIEIFQFVINLLEQRGNIEIRADEKDITFYL